MKIIIKFLFNNIKEKKFRTFLIVFSIAMSSALFFAANAMSTTIVGMYSGLIKSYVGSAEIIVTPDEKSPSEFLYENKADNLKGDFDYIIGSIGLTGVYKPSKDIDVNISLNGYDFKELQVMNPITLQNDMEPESFVGKKIIISKTTAEKYNLSLGDYIDLQIKDSKYKFQIAGIAKIAGMFTSEKQNAIGIVPKDSLYNMAEGRGKVSTLYIKTKNPEDKQKVIDELSKVYKNYSVKEAVTEKEMQEATNMIVVSLNMMEMLVLAISIFIIYSAFKVITTERLTIVGTFRSIGATKKMMNLVLIGESLIYGIIGGVCGLGIGFGVLYLMAMVIAAMFGGIKTTINFTPPQMITAFILAIVLSIISSMVPIIRVSKISVKDIVLNDVSKAPKKKYWKLIAGIILMIVSITLPKVANRKTALLLDGSSMLFIIIATVFLIPYVTLIFVKILEKLYSFIFGNEGIIAVKNLKGNKSVLNNISLLAIGMSSLLMINTVSSSLAIEVPLAYKQFNFQIWAEGSRLNDAFMSKLKNLKGVEDLYGVYTGSQVKISNSKETIGEIDGVSKNKFLDFYKMTFLSDSEEMLGNLSTGRNIIITKSLRDKLNIDKGSKITLEMNKKKREYTVIGLIDTNLNNGNMAFINDKYFKQDMNVQNYSYFYIKTNQNPSDVKKVIDKKYSKDGLWTDTIEDMTQQNIQGNAQMMGLLNGFAIMAMVIGVFGIVNNYMISFMERKRSLAMFRSLGMSKKQNIKVLFIESFTGGAIGGITGIISGLLLLYIMPFIMSAIVGFDLPMHYSLQTFSIGFILGILITIIASIGPASKSSKLDVIEAIKYE